MLPYVPEIGLAFGRLAGDSESRNGSGDAEPADIPSPTVARFGGHAFDVFLASNSLGS